MPTSIAMVRGVVLIGPEVSSFAQRDVRIFLEDVGRADATATVVAHRTIPNVSHLMGQETSVAFQIAADGVYPRNQYSLRAHIAVVGQEGVHIGDCVSVQSYPVLTCGHPDQLVMQVKELKE